MSIEDLRREYHWQIRERVESVSASKKKVLNYPSFADETNRASREIAWGIFSRLEAADSPPPPSRQITGTRFESITASFVEEGFHLLRHIRPGDWFYSTRYSIPQFNQYEHMEYLNRVQSLHDDPLLASALDDEYIIRPDIIVGRQLITDEEINRHEKVVTDDEHFADLTSLRAAHNSCLHLHASISCIWKTHSNRAHSSYIIALDPIRNRKGRLPHIAVVTAEPLPTRLAAIALGTGDVDCVYHFALHEMRAAIEEIDNEDQMDMLDIMIQGKRLRDISDLPFDLAM